MLTKKQIEKYADVMIWGLKISRKRKFKKGSIVAIRYDTPALELAEVIFHKLTGEGFNITPRANMTENMSKSFYDLSDNSQLKFIDPWMPVFCDTVDGTIYLNAPLSLTHLQHVDPKKFGIVARSNKGLVKIQDAREDRGMFGWTLCTYPTEELAEKAGLTLKQYTNQIIRACYLNDTDPINTWENINQLSKDIIKKLGAMKVKYFHVESLNTDLKIYPGSDRKWLSGSGYNVPSFEIFTSPDFHLTEGKFFADIPSYAGGSYIEKVSLEFKNGSVVSASSEEGNDFVNEYIKTDKGASQVGEFALVDKRFSKINKFMADTLFDENYGGKHGSCHIALGRSYLQTYKGNKAKLDDEAKEGLGFNDSSIHWDLVNSEDKIVTAHLTNGKTVVIYEKGQFC